MTDFGISSEAGHWDPATTVSVLAVAFLLLLLVVVVVVVIVIGAGLAQTV
jgi:hypothetical protein